MDVDEPIQQDQSPSVPTQSIPVEIIQLQQASPKPPAKEHFKPTIPMQKVKQIMKLDPKVQATQDAVYAITVATQLFLELLTMESFSCCKSSGQKTIQYQHIAQIIGEIHEFEFLTDIVPLKIPYEDALEKRAAFEAELEASKEL
jgi:histone H3/H4